MSLESINPYNNKLIERFDELGVDQLNSIINKAEEAFKPWRRTSFEHRAEPMRNAAQVLRGNKEEYAKAISLEMGKPINEAKAEVEKCAWVCEYYADNAELFLKPKTIDTDAQESFVSYEPLGVVLAVMPWNFPFWQVFRFAAPSLMAGNIALLKHASNVCRCAILIEEVFAKAGFPEGTFNTLLISSAKVEHVIKHSAVKAITLTGSEAAGASVASIAGKEIKKTVLELGGSNAFIVFKDADIEKAARLAVKARMLNTGQSCIAAKRFIVHQNIVEDFTKALKGRVEGLKSGDPLNKETTIGPLARVDLAEELEKQVEASLNEGAKLIIGGGRKEAYYEPTILTNVKPFMTVFREETFGPVATITTFETDEGAIKLSNNSEFGLGVTLFTKDIERAKSIATELEEGAVFINELVKSDPRLPFGGVKKSGYGCELSQDGIMEFVNKKTVYIA